MRVFIILVSVILINGQDVFDKPEGSECQWMGAIGTCVNIRRCPSAAYDIRTDRTDRKPPICSFQGVTPIICCTDCDILSVEESIKDVLDRDYYQSDSRAEKMCLAYEYVLPYECKTHVTEWLSARMLHPVRKCFKTMASGMAPVGSQDAKRGDFPHMALLGYGQDLESAQWLCGGSLISERYILTAAHCGSAGQLGAVRYVSLGMLKRSDEPSRWEQYGVKRFIPHPDYNPPHKYHDIALIETDVNVNWTEGVRPACLSAKRNITGDETAVATGWGALGPRKPHADVMQKVILKKLTEAQCRSLYPVHRLMARGYDPDTQMCYGDLDQPRDTCYGDSGGPLQLRDRDAKYCVYVVVGVTSHGRPCGTAPAGGIYTRVATYLPWIEGIVWPPNKVYIRDIV